MAIVGKLAFMWDCYFQFVVPRFRESAGTLNLIRPSVCQSLCLSVCHKNFNLGHNFCTVTGRALILGMCVLCDKTFPMVPCRDLDCDLWPTSRSKLLPSGGPQFSEFACFFSVDLYHLSHSHTTSFYPFNPTFKERRSFEQFGWFVGWLVYLSLTTSATLNWRCLTS